MQEQNTAVPGEVQTAHQGKPLYCEGGQMLEQASEQGGWCFVPVSIHKAFG